MNPDIRLINQAKSGDVHAFAALYRTVYKDLYHFALYTLHHPQDAEDAVSETVLDAFARIQSLREAEAFKAWIFRILTAKCARRIRQYVNQTSQLDENLCSPEKDICEASDIQRAMAALSSEDRLIVSMNLFAGYSSKEIGDALHMNPNTVRSRCSRALKKMGEMLQDQI